MNQEHDVSVVISTYNRCEELPGALASVLAQETHGVRYEVVVVDNNSTDQTRAVVESFIARGATNMRYIFESKQGLSYGRNAGIQAARAPLIAFTDDDVRARPDWVAAIKQAFDAHREVDLIGGKVLPRWQREPPTWLTREHWSPLALLDYGDAAFYVNAEKPICLVGANLSFRREVFDRIGLFSIDFLRIGPSSSEDHELEVRLWRAGRQGMYVPEIVVTAEVQTERMFKAYHRKWYIGHGKSMALMRLNEIIGPDGKLLQKPPDSVKLFGVPAFVYRDLLATTGRWLKATMRRDESLSFHRETQVRDLIGYISKCYEQNAAERKHSGLAEVLSFTRAMLHKKVFPTTHSKAT